MPNINKVVYGNNTLIDLTGTTATADKIMEGYGAFGRDGAWMDGNAVPEVIGDVYQDENNYVVLDNDTVSQIAVTPLTVTYNGTYTAPHGTAYSPVVVNVETDGELTIIVPEQTVTAEGEEGDPFYVVDFNDVAYVSLDEPLPSITCVYDGTTYELPYDYENDSSYGAPYNSELDVMDFSDYPIAVSTDFYGGAFQTAGEHTIEITGIIPPEHETIEPFEKIVLSTTNITPTATSGTPIRYRYSLPRYALSSVSGDIIVYYNGTEYTCSPNNTLDLSWGDSNFIEYPFYILNEDRGYSTAYFPSGTSIDFGITALVKSNSGTLAINNNGSRSCSGYETVSVSVYSKLASISITRNDNVNVNVTVEGRLKINTSSNFVDYESSGLYLSPNSSVTINVPAVDNNTYLSRTMMFSLDKEYTFTSMKDGNNTSLTYGVCYTINDKNYWVVRGFRNGLTLTVAEV